MKETNRFEIIKEEIRDLETMKTNIELIGDLLLTASNMIREISKLAILVMKDLREVVNVKEIREESREILKNREPKREKILNEDDLLKQLEVIKENGKEKRKFLE